MANVLIKKGRLTIMKKTYAELKEIAREHAIDWQIAWADEVHYMSEAAEWAEHWRKIGKRYGLTREFEENGII